NWLHRCVTTHLSLEVLELVSIPFRLAAPIGWIFSAGWPDRVGRVAKQKDGGVIRVQVAKTGLITKWPTR
ncbi:MAG TPA: hypothetical protein DD473_06135, partial [Planctomycetaceae bacterium]|nr:hypothetical protein [Planctomycetaceae bacterium]